MAEKLGELVRSSPLFGFRYYCPERVSRIPIKLFVFVMNYSRQQEFVNSFESCHIEYNLHILDCGASFLSFKLV